MSEHSPPVTVRDCLRNVLRRNGHPPAPSAHSVAAPLTDVELFELIIELDAILMARQGPA